MILLRKCFRFAALAAAVGVLAALAAPSVDAGLRDTFENARDTAKCASKAVLQPLKTLARGIKNFGDMSGEEYEREADKSTKEVMKECLEASENIMARSFGVEKVAAKTRKLAASVKSAADEVSKWFDGKKKPQEDGRMALAVGDEERKFYGEETGVLDARPLPAAKPSPLDEDIRRLREEKRKLDEQATAWEARKGDDPWAASDNSAWADPWRAETPSQLGTPGPDSTSSDRDDWARDGGRLEDIADQLTPANIAAEGHDSYRKALEEMERREMAEAQRRREEAKRTEMAEVQRKLEMDAKRRGQEVEHSREEIVRRKPERREASKTGRRSGSGLFGSGDAGQYARRREEATRQADSRRRQEAATRREEGRRRQEAATRQADSRRRQEAATRREEGRRRQRQEAEGQAALQRRQQEIAKQKRQHERHETVRKRAWVAKSYPCSEDGAPGQGAAYIRRMAPKHIMSRTTLGTRNCDRNSIEKSARDFYGKCSAARRKCTRTSGKFVYDLELDEKDIVHSCKFTWKMTSRCMPYQPWRFTPSVGNSGSVQ